MKPVSAAVFILRHVPEQRHTTPPKQVGGLGEQDVIQVDCERLARI
jgi:hypothetical protein